MVMVGLLLAAALTFDCTNQFLDIEYEGKIYNYAFLGKEKKELIVGGNSYECSKDIFPGDGPGIRTHVRVSCGPLKLFSQIYNKRCTYDDYNPPPYGFDDYENGKRLLNIQHQCIKTGLRLIDGWEKLRDKSGVEWELEDVGLNLGLLGGENRRAICSSKQKIEIQQMTFKIKKTGDIVDYYEYTTYQIRSIKDKPRPAF